MSNLFFEAERDMQVLTQTSVRELLQIWKNIFDQDAFKENLVKLTEHTKNFFEDLVVESMEKQEQIEKEIADLRAEAENLQRLLKVEINLKPSAGVPLLVFQAELDESLLELRETLRLRREQIFELLLEQDGLCNELDEEPRSLVADPLPTEEELENFRQHLEHLKAEKVNRLHRVSTMRREIKNFLQILEIEVFSNSDDRLLNHRQIKLNKETFEGLTELHNRFKEQVMELEDSIHGMKKKLNTLWDRLNTSPATRNKFSRFTDCSQSTYDILHKEVNRCETMKKQNIKLFVEQIRAEIIEWWDKCMKSDVQRTRFSNFYSDCYTDDLLILHEMELEDLKSFYENNEKIFQLFEDRRILWDRMTALEQKASEPGRYNNRGGQLLKEEKERKTIASKLPKIETQLAELVNAYEEKEHKKFTIYGEDILELISRDWEKKRMEKEKLSSARKNPQTPLANRTPMSIRNCQMSATSIRRTPSTTNVSSALHSNKRKLAPADRQTPSAKRSLMTVLNSPSIFTRSTTNNTKTPFKSPFKKNRVIATTIRRRSARQSGSNKKRRSSSRVAKGNAPKIVITESSDLSDTTTDNYEHFRKCIEPASRSSVVPTSMATPSGSSSQRKAAKENVRLPNPRLARMPSKLNLMDQQSIRKSPAPSHHTSSSTLISSSSKKLTTKNLPILI